MKEECELVSAESVFVKTMEEIMNELGLTYANYTKEEMDILIRCGTREYNNIWDDLMTWVMYEDHKKRTTRKLIRSSIRNMFHNFPPF